MTILIKNAQIINSDNSFTGDVLIKNEKISSIREKIPDTEAAKIIDASGLLLLPGVIDDHVHFRTPGLTNKGDIESESKAAVAGGVTSFMDMPNVLPPTTTIDLLNAKKEIAQKTSWANYSFYFGATNENISEIKKIDPKEICGLKVFMGSSTGNMLVDKPNTLAVIFAESPVLIAVHCEDEKTIAANTQRVVDTLGENIPFYYHPKIRTEEACYKSTAQSIELALKYNAKLHVMHVSTAKELTLFDSFKSLINKYITSEVCISHLWFSDEDYEKKQSLIKCNPAIKTEQDRQLLRQAIVENKIDVIATDHAPHTFIEKQNKYLQCPSGIPSIQHSLVAMLELVKQGVFSYNQVVDKMVKTPASLFQIKQRGEIKEGYYADLVLVDPNKSWTVSKDNILYKCRWSPFESQTFSHKIVSTLVNGNIMYENGSFFYSEPKQLYFNR